MNRAQGDRPRIGLALAGGGPAGGVYEVGVLRALEESIDGLDLNNLDIYVGVSAGGFLCAHLVNGVPTIDMVRDLIEPPVLAERFLSPAVGEIVRSGARLPWLLVEALMDKAARPTDLSLLGALAHLARALPIALFDGAAIRRYAERAFSRPGRTDDFRKLKRKLVLVAADLDSGDAIRFGEPGFDHVPISLALQASSALPGLYPPVRIDGREYVDGVLLKTLHASVALDAGAKLVLCVNPIVPVDVGTDAESNPIGPSGLAGEGLPMVLSQTFRTLIHSRLQVGMAAYVPRYPDQDVILFEPQRDDYRMFFTNIFSFEARRIICEHAYERTRRSLLARADELDPLLRQHGLALRWDILRDESRNLWSGVGVPLTPDEVVTQKLDRVLLRLEALLKQRQSSVTGPEDGSGAGAR